MSVQPRGRSLTPWDGLFVVACIASVLLLLWLSAGITFFHDEWDFIRAADDWSLSAFMTPYNEHWSLLRFAIYKPLLATVGMESYLPYLLVLRLLHVGAAAAVYVYARRQTFPAVALAVGVLFLLLGSAGGNIFWAALIDQTMSVAAGGWALVLLLREPLPRHAGLAAILLIASVASSGVGLFFLPAAAAALLVPSARRRYFWSVVPAGVIYLAWYLAYGRDSVGELAAPLDVARYAADGIAMSIGQLSGVGSGLGLVLGLLLLVTLVASILSAGPVRLGLLAGTVGLVTEFVLIGLVRAGPETTFGTRYVFPAAFFLLIAAVSLLGRRPRSARARRGWAIVGLLVFGIALAWNVNRLLDLRDLYRTRGDETRAAVSLLTGEGGRPAISPGIGFTLGPRGNLQVAGPDDQVVISASEELVPLVERMGSPVTDPLRPNHGPIPEGVIDRILADVSAAQGHAVAPPGPTD